MSDDERFGDGDMRGISLRICKCNRCKHVNASGTACAAFPRGIPQEIMGGRVSHEQSYRGDGGIQFEARA